MCPQTYYQSFRNRVMAHGFQGNDHRISHQTRNVPTVKPATHSWKVTRIDNFPYDNITRGSLICTEYDITSYFGRKSDLQILALHNMGYISPKI